MSEKNQSTPIRTQPDNTKCKKCKQQKTGEKQKTAVKNRLQHLPKVFFGVAIGPVLAQILCTFIALMKPIEEDSSEKWAIGEKVSLASLLCISAVLVALMFLLLIKGSRRNSYRMLGSTHLLGEASTLFLVLFPIMTSRVDHFVLSSPLFTILIVVIVANLAYIALMIYIAVCFSRYKKICKCPPEQQPKSEVTTTRVEPSLVTNPTVTKTTRTNNTTTTRREESPVPLPSKPKKAGMTLPPGMLKQPSPTSSTSDVKQQLELADVEGSLAELNEEEEREEKEKRKKKKKKSKKRKAKKRDSESEMTEVEQEKSTKAPSEKEVSISRTEVTNNSKMEYLPEKTKTSQKTAKRKKRTVEAVASVDKTQ